MATPGDTIEISGLLQREAGGFVLRGDDGRHYLLELGRTPVDLIAKRAHVTGELRMADVVTVQTIGPV